MSLENRDAAIREAKIFVREVVRNDWQFNSAAAIHDERPTSSSSSSSSIGTLYKNREVSEWRCREFDSSGSELEPQSSDDERDMESPPALRTLGDPAIERRRKRRRQMEEEMAWNEGLRMWMARRDAWSGARTRRQIRAKAKNKSSGASALPQSKDRSGMDGVSSAADSGAGISPTMNPRAREADDESGLATKTEAALSIAEKEKCHDQQRRQDQDEEQSTAPDEETKRKESTETSITEPDQNINYTTNGTTATSEDSNLLDEQESDEEEELDEPLIPVAPPFIAPTNPIRATINPSIYPSIYTKVVVQGMTPTVPVNLADLTKAMVQGWKADGQWPPKPAVSSIVLQDDATVPKAADSATDGQTHRRKNSITNAMRKVFHMGTHPFHRRGSGSQDAGAGNGNATGSLV
ncbi:hypothetical protein N7462_003142 [Penicillium macrosclerotiorum]|uniref:uncharacterized protein n=1 Tax=Penicillium macrosclerotiorum TaxID=303699 RepID=UPI0025484E45|nr:uncharacterized protein N7462_003142 [Penicillium macrosclerotiorum]KAJ5688750.1 hypothetical protein N7462_003142 [Penicillium macrosclerotiorum]